MSTTLIRTGKGESAHLRDALLEARQRLQESLAQIEKALSGVKTTTGVRTSAMRTAPARPSPLDRVKGVAAATADLRERNGNLSAARVANVFGVSLSQLAGWLGRTKQAVSKTPDADSLQEALGYFERVARLRMVMQNAGEFRKWLRTSHDLLENASPLDLLAKGERQAVADYVDDMLTGAST